MQNQKEAFAIDGPFKGKILPILERDVIEVWLPDPPSDYLEENYCFKTVNYRRKKRLDYDGVFLWYEYYQV